MVTLPELEALRAEAEKVRLPVSVTNELVEVRRAMEAEGLYCSPRRWKQIRKALQASALINGRYDVDERDFPLLRHSLWSDVSQIPALEKILEPFLTSGKERAAVRFGRILERIGEFEQMRKSTQNRSDISKMAIEARFHLEEEIREIRELKRKSAPADQQAIDDYLQRAYEYLRQLDEAAGL